MKTNYKRRSTKKSTVSKKSVAAIAKKVVLANVDEKYIATNYNNVALAGFAATLTPFNAPFLSPSNIGTSIVFGQQDSARIGSKLRVKKIKVGYYLTAGPGIARATARLMLVRHKSSLGQPINALEILQWSASPLGLSQVSSYQPDLAYEVLYDKTILYGNQDITGQETVKRFTLDYSKRPLLLEYFITSTTGTQADVISGNMNWLMICSDPSGFMSFDQKVIFYEQ